MQSRKLSEHVEEELFNKEKRVTVDPEKVIKTTPKIVKEYTFGSVPPPVKKKKPYYRKRNNKPKPIEVVEPETKYTFLQGLIVGLIIGIVVLIITNLIN